MTLHLLSLLENLCRQHPVPWYIEQNNDSGVSVKDCIGETVFFDDFGSIPDDMPSHQSEAIETLKEWVEED